MIDISVVALSMSFWLPGFWIMAFAVSSEIPRVLNFSIALGTAGVRSLTHEKFNPGF
jgi:hypothetical protein